MGREEEREDLFSNTTPKSDRIPRLSGAYLEHLAYPLPIQHQLGQMLATATCRWPHQHPSHHHWFQSETSHPHDPSLEHMLPNSPDVTVDVTNI